MDALVTTDWLAEARDSGDVRIADASYFLPEHQRDAAAEFRAAHIPGAVFFDLATLSDRDDPLPSMLPPANEFAERMQRLGIGRDDRIVVYDNSPLHSAARAWWMLRLYGARQVAILDGGLTKWEAEGRPAESGDASPEPARFDAELDYSDVRAKRDMLANLNNQAEQIVDARSPARFAGEEPEARPGVVPGHIPGSRDLYYANLFHSDGTWKQGDELRRAFEEAGVDLATPIVTTCGSGITAATLVFGAYLLGVRAALYDGSWSEWGGDPETPKATGRA